MNALNVLFGLFFRRFLIIEENKAEDKDAEHHRERADIIGISGQNEALVLGVLKGSDTDLSGTVDIRESDSLIVHFELIDTINVGYLEVRHISVSHFLQDSPHKRINSDEFQLNISAIERNPFSGHISRDLNGEDHVFQHSVGLRRHLLSQLVVSDASHTKYSLFFEHPFRESDSQRFVSRFLYFFIASFLLNGRREEGVAEEVERTGEYDARVVSGLKCGHQKCILADGQRILFTTIAIN
jgi:hypothetical protein